MRFLIRSSFVIFMFLFAINSGCFAKQSISINELSDSDVAEDLKKSRDFIRYLNDQINNIYSESKEHYYRELREIVRKNTDIQKMAKLVMGKNWQLASEEEKEAFTQEYNIYLERLYISNLYKFKGKKVTVIGSQYLGNSNYLVSTRFNNNNNFISVNHKLRKANNSFYITDTSINGISIIVAQRLKFEQRIEKDGLENVMISLKQSNSNNNF